MAWLTIAQSILSLATLIVNFMNNRKMIESGEALAILEGINYATETIQNAKKARTNARDKFNESGGVPDDNDSNLRD